jgi:hypothetical protein
MEDNHESETESEQPGAFERYRDAVLELGGLVAEEGFQHLSRFAIVEFVHLRDFPSRHRPVIDDKLVEDTVIAECFAGESLWLLLSTHVNDEFGDPTEADYPYTHEVE